MRDLIQSLAFKGYAFDRVLDIGANRGEFAREVKAFFPQAEIHVVEPNQDHFPLLAPFILHPYGLSHSDGTATFYLSKVDRVSTGASLYRENTAFYSDDNVIRRDIQIRRLDDLFQDRKFDVIKCDVQGGELDVINGGEDAFRQASLLIIELSFVPYNEGGALIDAVWTRLQGLGWVPVDACEFIHSNLFNRDRIASGVEGQPIQMTMVFERGAQRASQNSLLWALDNRALAVEFLRKEKQRDSSFRVLQIGPGAWAEDLADAVLDGDLSKHGVWTGLLDRVAREGRFDYALCTGALPQLAEPRLLLRNLPLAARAGAIAFPYYTDELSRNIQGNWLGFVQHRWLARAEAGPLTLIPKLPFLEHFIQSDSSKKVHGREAVLFWRNGLVAQVHDVTVPGGDAQSAQAQYREFLGV